MTDNESSDSDYTLLQIILEAQPTWAAICCVPTMCQVCHIWIRLNLYWEKPFSYTGNCHEVREMHTTLPASSTHPTVLSSAFQLCTLPLVIPCQFLLFLVWLSTSMWSCTLETKSLSFREIKSLLRQAGHQWQPGFEPRSPNSQLQTHQHIETLGSEITVLSI